MCSSILIKVLSKKNLKSCKVYLVHDGVKNITNTKGNLLFIRKVVLVST